MADAEDSPLFVTALAKGLSVLSTFTASRSVMNLLEIAEATGLNKSTVQRSVFTLESIGYLTKDVSSKGYRLTAKSLEIGSNYLQTSELIDRATPYLHELNRQSQESCNLLEPYGTEMVYVSRFASHKQISIHVPIGQRLPMFCTAAGRAYLAALPQDEAEACIRGSKLTAYTPNTVTDPDELLALLKRVRTDGFAFSNEEYYVGDIAIGACIVNAEGKPLGSINISVPFSRWRIEQVFSELGPQIVNAARAISTAARGLKPGSAGRTSINAKL
ncbi:IclR family transcriptional regulator [Rhizobium tropici]|uniref:IclR family transcriptional regulator n=1 Tax=Rhizobium tropici TaxID=398 RepID=A0A329Y1J9_RHITR|nr:IclR family transcriptional regulator [Rhizobium tropici]RAX37859.1 IclR family transcriptional regulator [Rhizobium tropici]